MPHPPKKLSLSNKLKGQPDERKPWGKVLLYETIILRNKNDFPTSLGEKGIPVVQKRALFSPPKSHLYRRSRFFFFEDSYLRELCTFSPRE